MVRQQVEVLAGELLLVWIELVEGPRLVGRVHERSGSVADARVVAQHSANELLLRGT